MHPLPGEVLRDHESIVILFTGINPKCVTDLPLNFQIFMWFSLNDRLGEPLLLDWSLPLTLGWFRFR